MNVLITGGCGFVGSSLAVYLSERGHGVVCADNLSRRGSEVLLTRVSRSGARFVHADARNAEDLERIPGNHDLLIDCSAEPSVLVGSAGEDARFLVNNNLGSTVNCLEWCRKRGAALLFLSTSRVYPCAPINALHFRESETRFELAEPAPGVSELGIRTDFTLDGARSLYGTTKLCSELLVQEFSIQYGIPAIINRCGVIAGPWQLGKVDQGVFTYWVAAHHFGNPLKYIGFGGCGKQVRDVLHIDDLCDLAAKQIAHMSGWRAQVLNVGGGADRSLSLLETTALCRELVGRDVPVETSTEERPNDLIWYVTDNTEVEQAFDWTPSRDPRRTLSDVWEWLRRHEQEFEGIVG